MPRKPRINSTEHYFHVYNRSNNSEWFGCELDEAWRIALESLKYANRESPIELYQFVLMNNHFHMLVKSPNGNLSIFMHRFGKHFSEKLKIATAYKNRMFGGRFKASMIDSPQYLNSVYRYIYQNPLRAKAVERCEEYPYSSLFYLARKKEFVIPLTEIIEEYKDLEFINKILEKEEAFSLKKGLLKKRFKPFYKRKY